jgi:Adenylate and Guanylate cyclase catalytic domain
VQLALSSVGEVGRERTKVSWRYSKKGVFFAWVATNPRWRFLERYAGELEKCDVFRTPEFHKGPILRVELLGGREVNTTGDGFMATFDGPARAIRCASAITEGVDQLGLQIRAGLHTGECELLGDDVGGIAVHIGARVAANAGPGEVLVSSTVRDLVAGSGIRFEDRGVHPLKGVPGEWRLLAVQPS